MVSSKFIKMKLAILGSGFISKFYADALVAQRRKDIIVSVLVNAKPSSEESNTAAPAIPVCCKNF